MLQVQSMFKLTDRIGYIRKHGEMPRPLDCFHELALVLRARAGDTLGDDFALLGNEPAEPLFVFIIDKYVLIAAKAASSAFTYLAVLLNHNSPCDF
jgi:hypothetical protein